MKVCGLAALLAHRLWQEVELLGEGSFARVYGPRSRSYGRLIVASLPLGLTAKSRK